MQFDAPEKTKDLLDRLSESCGIERAPHDLCDKELMTWEQLKEVASDNITVASHTVTHPVLSTIDKDWQRRELETSKAVIAEKIGIDVHSVAYPVGGYRHFTDETMKITKECGYEIGYSCCTGFNRWETLNPFDVCRIAPLPPPSLVVAATVAPEVFDYPMGRRRTHDERI